MVAEVAERLKNDEIFNIWQCHESPIRLFPDQRNDYLIYLVSMILVVSFTLTLWFYYVLLLKFNAISKGWFNSKGSDSFSPMPDIDCVPKFIDGLFARRSYGGFQITR